MTSGSGDRPRKEGSHGGGAYFFFSLVPKGPSRTKNTTTIAKIVNYYAVVFLLRPPNLLRRGPFSERENVCNSQENGVRTRCGRDSKSQGDSENTTRSKFTTRSIFSTAGVLWVKVRSLHGRPA